MTRAQEIRHEVLLQLHGAGSSIAISPAHIGKVAKRQGFDYSETEVRDALFFQVGQGHAEKLTDPATGEVRYRITSRGMIQFENGD
jgi:hypothetical protein